MSTEAVMLTATIDVLEGRDVEVLDIPGAYLSADMDNEVHVVFIGTLSEMMVMADLAPDPEDHSETIPVTPEEADGPRVHVIHFQDTDTLVAVQGVIGLMKI